MNMGRSAPTSITIIAIIIIMTMVFIIVVVMTMVIVTIVIIIIIIDMARLIPAIIIVKYLKKCPFLNDLCCDKKFNQHELHEPFDPIEQASTVHWSWQPWFRSCKVFFHEIFSHF